MYQRLKSTKYRIGLLIKNDLKNVSVFEEHFTQIKVLYNDN
jgi:hypothetical protein